MIPIFIGYDVRESVAFHVCVDSIIKNSSCPVSIIPLSLNLLDGYQETHSDGSNYFTYSRFLVPYLMGYQGWAIFIDGDMAVLEDIKELWDLRNTNYDVQVVKHDYKTKMEKKYLGAINENYPRKNWSSVVLWNCGSPTNQLLTPDFIGSSTGEYLHRFSWIDDKRIGSLPAEWNWLVDEYGENNSAKLLHWTLGTPCFNEFQSAPGAKIWHDGYANMISCYQNDQ